jgi:hypothetical protein
MNSSVSPVSPSFKVAWAEKSSIACHHKISANAEVTSSFASYRDTHVPFVTQSAGGFSISQKSPAGLSNSSPSSHKAPSTSERTRTILPFLLRPLETSSTVTGVSFISSSRTITPHPCALTTTVSYCPENLHAGPRLVIRTGICRDSRVLRLASFLCPSNRSLPLESRIPQVATGK